MPSKAKYIYRRHYGQGVLALQLEGSTLRDFLEKDKTLIRETYIYLGRAQDLLIFFAKRANSTQGSLSFGARSKILV